MDAKQKLLALGCKEEVVEGRWQILVASKTLEDLAQQIRENHLSCDIEQFLFPIFRPLYKDKIKEKVNTELVQSGFDEIPPEKYLTKMGNQPYVSLALDYEHLLDKRDKLRRAAQQSMFDVLKEYLGN